MCHGGVYGKNNTDASEKKKANCEQEAGYETK